MPTEIELKVRDNLNNLIDLLAENDGTLRVFVVNPTSGGGSGVVALDAPTLAALESISLNAGQVVGLDSATLAALETINALVTGSVDATIVNWPASQNVNGQVNIGNFPANQPISGSIGVNNWPAKQSVADDYQGGEVLDDQSGNNGVRVFNFTSLVQLLVIHVRGGTGRADPFGGVPNVVKGIVCSDDVPTYIPVTTASVQVYAPIGSTITVYGMRRA